MCAEEHEFITAVYRGNWQRECCMSAGAFVSLMHMMQMLLLPYNLQTNEFSLHQGLLPDGFQHILLLITQKQGDKKGSQQVAIDSSQSYIKALCSIL